MTDFVSDINIGKVIFHHLKSINLINFTVHFFFFFCSIIKFLPSKWLIHDRDNLIIRSNTKTIMKKPTKGHPSIIHNARKLLNFHIFIVHYLISYKSQFVMIYFTYAFFGHVIIFLFQLYTLSRILSIFFFYIFINIYKLIFLIIPFKK